MKKILYLALALLVTICAFVACSNEPQTNGDLSGSNEPDVNYEAPEGFSMYQNKEIAFAYPSDWTQIEENTFANADNTRSVTVKTEEKTTFYSELDTIKYRDYIRPVYQAEGKKLMSMVVGQETKDGVGFTYITETYQVEGVEGEIYQNIYTFNTKNKTYVITVTQPNGFERDDTLGGKIYETIIVK